MLPPLDQKMVIYASKTPNVENLLKNLPYWHPFCQEARQLNIDLKQPETYRDLIHEHPDAVDLKECGMFTNKELAFIDDDLKQHLRHEHFPIEGNKGISTRQMQNVVRDVILKSDEHKISVALFLEQLKSILKESGQPSTHAVAVLLPLQLLSHPQDAARYTSNGSGYL